LRILFCMCLDISNSTATAESTRFESLIWLVLTSHWRRWCVYRIVCEEQNGESDVRTRTHRAQSDFVDVEILVEIYSGVWVSLAHPACRQPLVRCLTVSQSSHVFFRCQVDDYVHDKIYLLRNLCRSSRQQKLSQRSSFLVFECCFTITVLKSVLQMCPSVRLPVTLVICVEITERV